METYELSQNMPHPRRLPYSGYVCLVFFAGFFISFKAWIKHFPFSVAFPVPLCPSPQTVNWFNHISEQLLCVSWAEMPRQHYHGPAAGACCLSSDMQCLTPRSLRGQEIAPLCRDQIPNLLRNRSESIRQMVPNMYHLLIRIKVKQEKVAQLEGHMGLWTETSGWSNPYSFAGRAGLGGSPLQGPGMGRSPSPEISMEGQLLARGGSPETRQGNS